MADQQRHMNVSSLHKLVLELNILRRHIKSYPSGHPLVEQALNRAYATISDFFTQSGKLLIGVTRNTLIHENDVLDSKEPSVRDFAGRLFSLGIISVTFFQGLRPDELLRFNEFLMMKHQDKASPKSIGELFDSLALEHITIGVLDYGAIQVQLGLLGALDKLTDFWERFVVRVIARILIRSLDNPAEIERYIISPPEMLADMISEGISREKATTVPALLKLLGHFMQQIDENTVVRDKRSFGKFIRFLHALKPEVRHYFLNSIVNALSDRLVVAEAFFDDFSEDLLADLLNEGLQKQGSVPPTIMSLLQRLSDSHLKKSSATKKVDKEKHPVSAGPADLTDETLKKKLHVIFREEERDKFIPEEYDATLSLLIDSRMLNKSEKQDILLLKNTLDNHEIEVKISGILLELIDTPLNGDLYSEQLSQSLLDLCGYFVRTGDFAALTNIYERTQQIEQPSKHQQGLLQAFLQPDFIDEILQAPVIWGKQKFEEITAFIHRVGEPFIDPILNRLSEEDNRSLRYFYISSLSKLGNIVIEKTAERLSDPRWYFIRNLVVILRDTGNPKILPFIRTLINYPHPKVRQDVQKTLLQFRAPEAFLMLLSDLSSSDFKVKMRAIRLAEKHHTQDIIKKLIEIVETGGFSPEELELRQSAVRTLSGIGDAACLPCFERILMSKSFLRRRPLNQLKDVIVDSLSRFSSPFALELLKRVSASDSRELALKAKKIAQNMEKSHGL